MDQPNSSRAEQVAELQRLSGSALASAFAPRQDHEEALLFGHQCHPGCIACREKAQGGLGLRFQPDGIAGVYGFFRCDSEYQGYPDRLHGGIIALALDAAMTHCLFFRQAQAVTAKLEIRYRRPVCIDDVLEVRARVDSKRGSIYKLSAEARQGTSVCVTATAIFVDLARSKKPQGAAHRGTQNGPLEPPPCGGV